MINDIFKSNDFKKRKGARFGAFSLLQQSCIPPQRLIISGYSDIALASSPMVIGIHLQE